MNTDAAAIVAAKRSVEKSLKEIVEGMRLELKSLTALNYGTKKIRLKALIDLYLKRLESQRKNFARWYGERSKECLDTMAEIERWQRFKTVNIEKLTASNVNEFKETISKLLSEIEETLTFELRTLDKAERSARSEARAY